MIRKVFALGPTRPSKAFTGPCEGVNQLIRIWEFGHDQWLFSRLASATLNVSVQVLGLIELRDCTTVKSS